MPPPLETYTPLSVVINVDLAPVAVAERQRVEALGDEAHAPHVGEGAHDRHQERASTGAQRPDRISRSSRAGLSFPVLSGLNRNFLENLLGIEGT